MVLFYLCFSYCFIFAFLIVLSLLFLLFYLCFSYCFIFAFVLISSIFILMIINADVNSLKNRKYGERLLSNFNATGFCCKIP